jgi:hypothetical protein
MNTFRNKIAASKAHDRHKKKTKNMMGSTFRLSAFALRSDLKFNPVIKTLVESDVQL